MRKALFLLTNFIFLAGCGQSGPQNAEDWLVWRFEETELNPSSLSNAQKIDAKNCFKERMLPKLKIYLDKEETEIGKFSDFTNHLSIREAIDEHIARRNADPEADLSTLEVTINSMLFPVEGSTGAFGSICVDQQKASKRND